MVSVSLNLIPQKTKKPNPKCKCGWPGVVKVGWRWYCNYCLDNGDDEDAEVYQGRFSGVRVA